jgi:hypothetical protein
MQRHAEQGDEDHIFHRPQAPVVNHASEVPGRCPWCATHTWFLPPCGRRAMQAGLEWQELLEIARPFAWMSLALALAAGYVSMIAIFLKNADFRSRPPLELEQR